MDFCGEITYETAHDGWVHSDVCWHKDAEASDEFRALLHKCLDEWLDSSKGSGAFWVGDPQYFVAVTGG